MSDLSQPRDSRGRFLPYPKRHGTWTGYRVYRCRCRACIKKYKETLKKREHNAINYREGCRCKKCRSSMNNYITEYRAKKTTPAQPLSPASRKHGTWLGYDYYKCRCDKCKKAAAKRELEAYHTRVAKGLPKNSPHHGTKYGYQSWGCRCAKCKTAGSEYYKARYQARKKNNV